KTDVCGRGIYGIECMLGDGATGFSAAHFWSFDADRRGDDDFDPEISNHLSLEFSDADPGFAWRSSPAYHASIQLVDVNRDGLADLCARGPLGLYCALSTGTSFEHRRLVFPADFTDALGWANPIYGATVRFGDLDGDARVDVCGRGFYGVVCAEGY